MGLDGPATLRFLGATSANDIGNQNRTLDLAGGAGNDVTLDASGAGTLIFTVAPTATGAGAKTLVLKGTGAVGVVNSIIGIPDATGGASVSVTKDGSGTWQLNGACTYSGDTRLIAGKLIINNALALQNSALSLQSLPGRRHSAVWRSDVGESDCVYLRQLERLARLGAEEQQWHRNRHNADGRQQQRERHLLRHLKPIGGAIIKVGSGTLTLSGANSFTGDMTLSGGTLVGLTDAKSLGQGALKLNTASTTLELVSDAPTSYGRNTTISADVMIKQGRVNSGAGRAHTLGTLSIGANTLSYRVGALTASGGYSLTFGATTLTGAPVFDLLNGGGGTAKIVLGALTGNFDITKQNDGLLDCLLRLQAVPAAP